MRNNIPAEQSSFVVPSRPVGVILPNIALTLRCAFNTILSKSLWPFVAKCGFIFEINMFNANYNCILHTHEN